MENFILNIIQAIVNGFGVAISAALITFFISLIFKVDLIQPPTIRYIIYGIGIGSFIISLVYYTWKNKIRELQK